MSLNTAKMTTRSYDRVLAQPPPLPQLQPPQPPLLLQPKIHHQRSVILSCKYFMLCNYDEPNYQIFLLLLKPLLLGKCNGQCTFVFLYVSTQWVQKCLATKNSICSPWDFTQFQLPFVVFGKRAYIINALNIIAFIIVLNITIIIMLLRLLKAEVQQY